MAFQEVSDLSTDNAIALGGVNRKTNKPNPTSIQGYYVGSKEVSSPKSKTGKAQLHVFQTAKGNVGVWGKTDLDIKMRSAVLGAMTRVTFTGMQETKNNPMYKYKVEIDRENAISVQTAEESDAYATTDDYESDDYGSDTEENDVDEAPLPAATAPRTPATTPSAAAQAEVRARLSGRRS